MPELTKLRKDHDAKNAATVATESNIPSNAGLTVEIRIPADLATTSNRQVFFICWKINFMWYKFFVLKRKLAFAVKSNYFETVILVLPYFSQIRGRQLWGTDVYTDDSDIVAGNIDQHGYESIDTPRLLFTVQISFTYRSCCSVKRRSL
jgi:hypothetical protein